MEITKEAKEMIEQELERLKKETVDMRFQMEKEINRRNIHIYALEEMLKNAKGGCKHFGNA